MTPLIGITCGWREDEKRHHLHDEYVQVVYEAGGIPVLLPTGKADLAESYYEYIDGLILSGGGDPDPVYYGEEPLRGIREITPARDDFEVLLSRMAMSGKKPVLAVCRGMQVLNVAAGGSLYQDLGGVTRQEHMQQAPRYHGTHYVELDNGSFLYRIVQKERIRVNSFHHQGVKLVGNGLKAVAWSSDGLTEAVEAEDGRYVFGVQWHPECCWEFDAVSFRLFRELVCEARIKGNYA